MKLKQLLEYNTKDIPKSDMPLELFEMATIAEKRSGVNLRIWTSMKRGSYGPRIKVTQSGEQLTNSNSCSISISDNPRILAGNKKIINSNQLKLVSSWIILNKDVLLKLWNGGYDDSGDFLDDIKKV